MPEEPHRTGAYRFIKVWEEIPEGLNSEIAGFWKRNDALPPGEDAQKRAGQAVFIVRDGKGDIVAVSTAVKTFVSRFRNDFYILRGMIDSAHRRQGLGLKLLIRARDFFEELFRKGETSSVGILFNLENERIGAVFRQAVWPRTGFIFMGYNNRGQQIRAYYFDGAKI